MSRLSVQSLYLSIVVGFLLFEIEFLKQVILNARTVTYELKLWLLKSVE